MSSRLSLLLLSAFILIMLVNCQPSRNLYNTRITAGRLFEYSFTEGQTQPDATHSHDVVNGPYSMGDMLLNTDSSQWCMNSIGVNFNGAGIQNRSVSVNDARNLTARITATQQWAFEAWFATANINQGGMIAGIGLWQPGAVDTVCSSPQGTTSLSIFQDGSSYGVDVLGGNANSPYCTSPTTFLDNPNPGPTHILATSDGTVVSLYLNGELGASFHMYNAYWRWNPAAHLYLAQQRNLLSPGPTWKGKVLLVSMYDRALAQAEIATNYNAGLPNSKPVGVTLGSTTVPENELAILSNMSLSYFDFDNDSCTLYLSSLPTIGQLYLSNPSSTPSPIMQSQLPLFITPTTRFAYQPPKDTFGPALASFQYYANDGTASGYPTTVHIDVITTSTDSSSSSMQCKADL